MIQSNNKIFIQCHDDPNGDGSIHLVASDGVIQAPHLSFVITQTDEAIYFGQIKAAALWLNRTAQDRFEPSAVETLHRIERNEIHNNAFFRLSQYQCVDLMVERRNGILSAPMTRPSAGSRWQIASAEEVSEFMMLPLQGCSIGYIAGITTREGSNIEMRLTEEILRHHILSAGQTGSGKSNTNVNIVRAAQQAAFCCLLYDMKPDYPEIHLPNDEPLPVGMMAKGLDNVSYWTLGVDKVKQGETAISVAACELDPSKLAQVIFYRPGEEMQQEVCEQLLLGFAINQEGAGNNFWTMKDFIVWLSSAAMQNPAAAGQLMPFPATFNAQTYNAVRGKVNCSGRIPSWIDAHARGRGALGGILGGNVGQQNNQNADQLFSLLRPGAVHVIRVRAEGDGRSYALFLDYAMRKVANLRRDEFRRRRQYCI